MPTLGVTGIYCPALLTISMQSIVRGSSDEESPKDPTEGRPHSHLSAMERALLLAFALKRRKETDTLSADQLKAFEKEIWLSHIHATVEEMETSVS